MRSGAGLFLALLLVAKAAAEGQFIRLDWPDGQLRQLPESCPIRIEIPVGRVFSKEHGGRYTTDKVRAVACQYASLQTLRISSEKGRFDPSRRKVVPGEGYFVMVKADVYLPSGSDQVITLRYRLIQGDTELADGVGVLEGDRGELNWGDGVPMQVTKVVIGSQVEPTLQVEATFSPR